MRLRLRARDTASLPQETHSTPDGRPAKGQTTTQRIAEAGSSGLPRARNSSHLQDRPLARLVRGVWTPPTRGRRPLHRPATGISLATFCMAGDAVFADRLRAFDLFKMIEDELAVGCPGQGSTRRSRRQRERPQQADDVCVGTWVYFWHGLDETWMVACCKGFSTFRDYQLVFAEMEGLAAWRQSNRQVLHPNPPSPASPDAVLD